LALRARKGLDIKQGIADAASHNKFMLLATA
jgi:hypothetical protein